MDATTVGDWYAETDVLIVSGDRAGAAAINMHEGFICTPFYPPHQFLESIIVDETGKRFINEDVYHGRLGSKLPDRPEGRYYLVIDSRHFNLLRQGRGAGNPGQQMGYTG